MTIVEPKFDDMRVHNTPLFQAANGVETKYKRYLSNWNMSKNELIPLAFESFGGYAPATFDFLKKYCGEHRA